MLFNILILVAFAAIIFVHYLRGFFSGIISAILAAFSAVIALSYYEVLTERFLAGKAANVAHAMMLLMLFAVVYVILRVIFDKAVPGNVRVPAVLDKLGGAVMGVVAGIFAVGSVAIAGQLLPLSPAPGGLQKYPMKDKRPVVVPSGAGRRSKDASTYDELGTDASASFGEEAERQGFWIISPDEILVSLTEHLSDGGSLSRRPLREMHPDLLQELFGQRLGIETGARRVVMNDASKGHRAISSVELFQIDSAPLTDFDYPAFRQKRANDITKLGTLKVKPNEMLLIARVMFTRDAGDPDDFYLRFSTGSVRLVGRGTSPVGVVDQPKDYHPYGTMDKGTLVANKLDDFLFTNLHQEDKGVDFAFVIERSGIEVDGPAKGGIVGRVKPGVFLEINRMGREDLSGLDIKHGLPASDKIEVLRKMFTASSVAQTPVAPVAPIAPTTPTPMTASAKLQGAWTGAAKNGDPITLEFRSGGVLAYIAKGKSGSGQWKVISETPISVTVERTIGENASQATIDFASDDEMTYTPPAPGDPMKMTRRK